MGIIRILGILKFYSSSKTGNHWNNENSWNYRNIWNIQLILIDSPPDRLKRGNDIENTWNLEFFENTMIIQVHWNNGNKQNFRNLGNIEM